ncbi:unnamed protein product [Allacma fusca]|uniref:Uncharacterized protein n=1 Tax=Allacma fusca TaxID=39272 RepID=A0A8J2JWV8_9HEXA|nr:unnamed protein product [Allacma fusca]
MKTIIILGFFSALFYVASAASIDKMTEESTNLENMELLMNANEMEPEKRLLLTKILTAAAFFSGMLLGQNGNLNPFATTTTPAPTQSGPVTSGAAMTPKQ